MKRNINKCPRCGRNHKGALIKRLSNHFEFTHWTLCPRTHQPILIHIDKDGHKVMKTLSPKGDA
jgi:hypothetical protein